ncbi:tRNA-dihydrouridine synthase [Patescibacteria group bacterium]|nr:tRNA-dihydrouridine synthase [Patescibacteria group bacterium]
MNFRKYIKNNIIVGLAPMDGVTDEAMRLLQAKIAKPDVIFTEFVSAEGLSRGGIKLYQKLLYSPTERPVVAQLFGKDPESFYRSAVILCELGFDGIDINMGCPSKKVSRHGSGATLIENPELAKKLIRAVKTGVKGWVENKKKVFEIGLKERILGVIEDNKSYAKLTGWLGDSSASLGMTDEVIESNKKYSKQKDSSYSLRMTIGPTVSVKTRLGINSCIIEKWIPVLLDEKIDFLTIHGRTLKQGYAGKADWGKIGQVVKMAKGSGILIWGNGDVGSRQEAKKYIVKYGVDGVLIGRKAVGNPWIFEKKTREVSRKEKFETMLLHAQIFADVFPERKMDCLRSKFLAYASGLSNAKKLRSKIVKINSVKGLLRMKEEFCGINKIP